MSVRKDLFIAIKSAIEALGKFELVDMQLSQFDDPKQTFGTIYTACLIEMGSIRWEDSSNKWKEGTANINVYIYTKEGFSVGSELFSEDNEVEENIDLIQEVAEKIEAISIKEQEFKDIKLTEESTLPQPHFGIFAYKLEFESYCHIKMNYPYVS